MDGVSKGPQASYALYDVTANHAVVATFAQDTVVSQFSITATAGQHGRIVPGLAQTVISGGTCTFAVQPDPGYHVADVTVDGVSVGAVDTYTFLNVTADHQIAATFAWTKLTTTTAMKVSARTIARGHYLTISGGLDLGSRPFSNSSVRIEYKRAGAAGYSLLKNVRVTPDGGLSYRFKVTMKGNYYYRLHFLGDSSYQAAPLKGGTLVVQK